MKFKYYLRGLGIGILISTIILSISFAMKKNDLSDDEIIARAKELGMVMEDTGKDTIPKATETEDEIPKSTEGSSNTEQTDVQPGTTDSGETPQDAGADGADVVQPSQDGNNVVQKEFTVEVGDSSNAVAQRLQEAGLVDNADAFNKYMVDNNYANFVLPGTVTIPEGAGYEEIAGILTDKTIHH